MNEVQSSFPRTKQQTTNKVNIQESLHFGNDQNDKPQNIST